MINIQKISEALKKYDISFFGVSTAIFIIGVVNLYSATHASQSLYMAGLYKTQIIWYVFSLVVGVVVSMIRPKTFKRYSGLFYGVNVFLLILVLLVGSRGMGAQRWLSLGGFRLQPSEITKIAIILILGRWYSRNNHLSDLGLKELIVPLIIIGFPMLLIVLQPDLGTGLMLLLIFLIVSFYRRLKIKTVGILAIVGIVSSGLMYQFGLKEYQRKRVTTFLNPNADAKGAGYNAIQSKIAIGSGQLTGKGILKSSQASLNYLPENHTDFVFSVYNEEHGLFGSLILIGLYLLLLFKFLRLAMSGNRMFNSIVAVGIMSLFFWHIFINMAMVMGIAPVVGLPLPFMSYGGSSLLTFSICNGIATSISNSKRFF